MLFGGQFQAIGNNQDQDVAGIGAFPQQQIDPLSLEKYKSSAMVFTVYNNTIANESSNVLSLLKYTKEYANTVAKENFFYLDTSTRTAEPRSAEALYNQMLVMETKYPSHETFIIPLLLLKITYTQT